MAPKGASPINNHPVQTTVLAAAAAATTTAIRQEIQVGGAPVGPGPAARGYVIYFWNILK